MQMECRCAIPGYPLFHVTFHVSHPVYLFRGRLNVVVEGLEQFRQLVLLQHPDAGAHR